MFTKDKISQSMIDSVSAILNGTQQEQDQLNELSKVKLAAYVSKSATSISNTAHSGQRELDKGSVKKGIAMSNTEIKRLRGVHKAARRLAREESELYFVGKLLQSVDENRATGTEPIFTDNNPNSLGEDGMSPKQQKKREEIVVGMKKNEKEFKAKYGKNWENVMNATATKMAMQEDTEQLDELSKDTLANYVKAASSSSHKSSAVNLASKGGYKLGKAVGKKDYGSNAGEEEDRKAFKRSKSITNAVNKLTKEEVQDFIQTEEFEQLDELSKSTVKSYLDKKMNKTQDAWREKSPTQTQARKTFQSMDRAYDRLKDKKPTSEEVVVENGDVKFHPGEIDKRQKTKDTLLGRIKTLRKDDVGPGSDAKSSKVKMESVEEVDEGLADEMLAMILKNHPNSKASIRTGPQPRKPVSNVIVAKPEPKPATSGFNPSSWYGQGRYMGDSVERKGGVIGEMKRTPLDHVKEVARNALKKISKETSIKKNSD